MGLSSLPGPSEGVLCVILVNTALSISLFKGILRSILHVVGIHLSSLSPPPPPPSSSPTSSSDYAEAPIDTYDFNVSSSSSYINEFWSRSATRFDAVCSCKQADRDCSVCLTEFEPDSEINYLTCGHFFHKLCLEKWLDYWNFTCPLCRSPLMPGGETRSCF